MPPLKKTANLPALCNSAILAKYADASGIWINFILLGVGTTGDYQYQDKDGHRAFVLRWDVKQGGHVLRVPLALWSANNNKLARDLMDQRRRPNACMVTIDAPELAPAVEPVAPALSTPATLPQTGTPANQEDVRIVVGPDAPQAGVPTEGENEAEEPVEEPAEEAPPAAPAPPLVEEPLHERANDQWEKPIRVKPFAEKLGVSEADLREAIAHPESRLEIAEAGWVKTKAE